MIELEKKTTCAAAPRQSSGTAAALSSSTLSDPSPSSDHIINLTNKHPNASSDTPLARWIRNGGAPEEQLVPSRVLYQIVSADCKQNGCDPDLIRGLVLLPILDLSEEEQQRVLGDTTYYVECLKKMDGQRRQ